MLLYDLIPTKIKAAYYSGFKISSESNDTLTGYTVMQQGHT